MILFPDNTTLVQYAHVATGVSYAKCKPTLEIVEQKHIIPIISPDLYAALKLAIENVTAEAPVPLSTPFTDLLRHCRMVAGPLFCYFHSDKADILFSDAGMQRLESGTNKTAYQEQRTNFKEANLSEAEDAIELLIQYLEDNISEFVEWTDSTQFAEYRSLFIKTGAEFNQFFPSASPHRNYWAMRTTMYDVEENTIRPFLGSELFDYLKTELAKPEPELTTDDKNLLFRLKKAIANYTVALAAPFLNVRIGSGGLTVPAVTSTSTNNQESSRSGAGDKALNAFIENCTAAGAAWINNANNYITSNPTIFTTWVGFATVAATDTTRCTANDNLHGSFGLY